MGAEPLSSMSSERPTQAPRVALPLFLCVVAALLLLFRALAFWVFGGWEEGVQDEQPTNWLAVLMVWPSLAAALAAIAAVGCLAARTLWGAVRWTWAALVIALGPSVIMLAIGVAQGDLADIVRDTDALVWFAMVNVPLVPLLPAALITSSRGSRHGARIGTARSR